MFYIISTIFGISGVVVLCFLKVIIVRFNFFYEHQSIFNIIFVILFIFLYNFCIYDYKPHNKAPYAIVNIIFIVVFALVNKIIYKK